jgi:2-iminobutanoate/2-iminopropanoate deaminase
LANHHHRAAPLVSSNRLVPNGNKLAFDLPFPADPDYTPAFSEGGYIMNRRVISLAGILALGGFLVAHGVFPQTDTGSTRRVINLPDRSPQAAFSNAILVGDTLYISGNIGLDSKTQKAPDKIDDEIKNLLEAYKTLLAEAGFTMDDLVYVQVSCTDLSLYDKFNTAYKSYFSKDLPAREFIGVASLLRGGHFEMQAIAVRSKNRP